MPWVIVKMLHGAIERTEEEVAELKAGGLFVRDASGPDDTHDAPAAGAAVPVSPLRGAQPAAVQPAASGEPEAAG